MKAELIPYDDHPAKDMIVSTINKARILLLSARDAKEAKQIVDMLCAVEVYARRQKLSDEIIGHAHAIKIDAMTRMGQFLLAAKKNKGAAGRGKKGSKRGTLVEPPIAPPTFAETGIDKKNAAINQTLATIKETNPELYEQVLAGAITVKAALSKLQREKTKEVMEDVVATLQAAANPNAPLFQVDQADCLEWFAAQPADSIHLVFGSPPYENARLYLEDGADPGIARDTAEWVKWMVQVYKAALRCCTGLVAFVLDGPTKNYAWSGSPGFLIAALIQEGITLRKAPIYHRVGIPGSGGPDWVRNDYEFILCATRGGPLPWSDPTAMGKPCVYEPGGEPSHRKQDGSRVNAEHIGKASMEDRNNVGPHRARQQAGRVYEPPEIANPGNVIRCSVGGGNMGSSLSHENEAPFPEALAEFFVRSFCPPGGIVCDPFSGSGTTGAMAVRYHRRFLGCDLRPSQVELSRRRMNSVQPLLPNFGD